METVTQLKYVRRVRQRSRRKRARVRSASRVRLSRQSIEFPRFRARSFDLGRDSTCSSGLSSPVLPPTLLLLSGQKGETDQPFNPKLGPSAPCALSLSFCCCSSVLERDCWRLTRLDFWMYTVQVWCLVLWPWMVARRGLDPPYASRRTSSVSNNPHLWTALAFPRDWGSGASLAGTVSLRLSWYLRGMSSAVRSDVVNWLSGSDANRSDYSSASEWFSHDWTTTSRRRTHRT